MEKFLKFMLCVIAITILTSITFGQSLEAQESYSNWSENDLFRTGRTLSAGATLTNPLQIDTSKIDVPSLHKHTVKKIGEYGVGIAADAIKPGAGTLIRTGKAGFSLWNAWRVGTGRAGPDVLRSTIPHVVQAWDAFKGPMNLPTQTFSIWFNRVYVDGAGWMHIHGTQRFRQEFSTTAPGIIGNYGFDPYTDTIVRQTIRHTIQHETFSVSQFNKMYQNIYPNKPLTVPNIPRYSPSPRIYIPPPPPPIRSYTPIPRY